MSADPVLLDLPSQGRWLARNGPARRVPSHETHLFRADLRHRLHRGPRQRPVRSAYVADAPVG